ncbi:Protein lethal(2)essential for life-like protein [Dinothrombium tinctorium]|uniref:Protein lethal(2)essential for life-like protein n=1 Tax=Dinothrombium tinctorium TaxID=1965070 RepID=A0A3S3RLZ0_9ACAR|nr:Protein lethal(2)essential for life-like protein [Dinothrombium tinctorium]
MSLLIPFDFTRDLLEAFDFVDRVCDINSDHLCPKRYRRSLLVAPLSRKPPRDDVRKGVKRNADGFKIQVDCAHFKPEELSVKTVDGELIVHGKHDERRDEQGFVKREFTRRYTIPKDVEAEQLDSSLDSEGTLTITAPRKKLRTESNERVIPITIEDTPRIDNSNSNKNDEQKEKQ